MPTSSFPFDASTPTYLWTQVMVEEWVRCGVDTFFVAPGSRSTPLTVAVARHPDARVVLHVDERGTAFAALGYGRATGRPAAWITTSGTAVANALPAVVEASTDGVPMLLLTADRPPELRDTGANQTIDQVKIFGDYTRWTVDVPAPSDDVDVSYVLTTVDQAVHRALRMPPGPVHVNCMFRKPLEPDPDGPALAVPDTLRAWSASTEPHTRYPTPSPHLSDADVDPLARQLDGVQRGLVVAGRLDAPSDADAVRRLAAHLGWPLLPDLTSRLRLGPVAEAPRVPYVDAILTSDAFRDAHAPDAVIHLGGRFVSKRLRLFVAASRPPVYAVVRPDPRRIDPDHVVTHHVESGVASFVTALTDRIPAADTVTPWTREWTQANARAASVLRDALDVDGSDVDGSDVDGSDVDGSDVDGSDVDGSDVDGADAEEADADATALTEPGVARTLTQHVPSDHALVAASSMPVRDLNRYAPGSGEAVVAFANRGASGIDGTVATAAGVAHGRQTPVTLLIGDLALWHDLNSLALLRDVPVVVVVINNDGGGIFHFLPIREHADVFDPYFTTPQGRTFEHAAATFDVPYHACASLRAVADAYRDACQRGASALIEVRTDRETNRAEHERLESLVAAAVER